MQAFLEQNEANESLMDLEFWAEIKLQPDVIKSSAKQEVCHLGLQEQKQRWCGHPDSVVKCTDALRLCFLLSFLWKVLRWAMFTMCSHVLFIL